MDNCLFCRIIKKEIPSKIVYEDDKVLAFEDIDPKAPVHILIIPKKHIPTILDISDEDKDIFFHIYKVINLIAKEKNLQKGFRTVINCNKDGGQVVFHLHFHLLGARKMLWPPG